MHIHLVTVEVGIVRVAIGVVHANRFLTAQHFDTVTHHTRFVQRRLTIENDNVAVHQVTVHFTIDLRRSGTRQADVGSIQARECRARLGSEQFVSLSCSFLDRHLVQRQQVSVFHLDEGGSRVLMGTVNDILSQQLNIVRRDRFRERQFASKDGWDTDLVRLDVDVG